MSFSLIPDVIINKITDINQRWLIDRGISLLLLDFDNTVLPYTKSVPGDTILDWLARLTGAGVKICIVSNSKKSRVPEFCEKYGIKYITRAGKPSPDGIERAIRLFDVPKSTVALIGDQIYTDIFAANRAGVISILCTPIHLSNIFLKLRHLAEKPFISIGRRRMGMQKMDRIKAEIKKSGLDALLLRDDISCRYVLDTGLSEGTALIMPDKAYYFTDSRYIEAARRDISGFEIMLISAENKLYDQLRTILPKGMRVGFEQDRTTVSELAELKTKTDAEFVQSAQILTKLRMTKQQYELARMKRAQEITDEVFADIIKVIRPGMTEKELAAEIIYRFYKLGADGLSFQPIVVSGPNSSLPHGVPTDRELESGDFITMDIGCVKDGYCSDMTRTVALRHVTDEMREVYNIVLKAQLAGIGAVKAGALGSDVDGAARAVIKGAGYGGYFGHGFGHGVGLEVHEAPTASLSSATNLPDGSVISAEPGIYIPGKFGVRIEDVIVITRDGCVNLTNSPKNLLIL